MASEPTAASQVNDTLEAIERALRLCKQATGGYFHRQNLAINQAWIHAIDTAAQGGLTPIIEYTHAASKGGGKWGRRITKPPAVRIGYKRRGEIFAVSDVKLLACVFTDLTKSSEISATTIKRLQRLKTESLSATPETNDADTASRNKMENAEALIHGEDIPDLKQWRAALTDLLKALAKYLNPVDNRHTPWGRILRRSYYTRKNTKTKRERETRKTKVPLEKADYECQANWWGRTLYGPDIIVRQSELDDWITLVVDQFLDDTTTDTRLIGYPIQVSALPVEQRRDLMLSTMERARLEIFSSFAQTTKFVAKTFAAFVALIAAALAIDAANWVNFTEHFNSVMQEIRD